MTKLSKLERRIMDKFKALHRFRVAETKEEKQAAVKYAKEYCERFNLKYEKEFSQNN